MPKVIGVIQVKGGAGRSTLSTNLAGELSKVGKTVLIDGDMPNDKMAIVTKNDLQVGWLADDALTNVVEPTLSSREKRESLQGSVGFIVENVGYNHLEIYGLA
jgi:cellulose biosynthesis protein BcsQ